MTPRRVNLSRAVQVLARIARVTAQAHDIQFLGGTSGSAASLLIIVAAPVFTPLPRSNRDAPRICQPIIKKDLLTDPRPPKTAVALAAVSITIAFGVVGTGVAHADSVPVAALPGGSMVSTTTSRERLISCALPHAASRSGIVWRVARHHNPRVVREIAEAEVGTDVVLVFKVVWPRRHLARLRPHEGDTSPKAVKAATHKVYSL